MADRLADKSAVLCRAALVSLMNDRLADRAVVSTVNWCRSAGKCCVMSTDSTKKENSTTKLKNPYIELGKLSFRIGYQYLCLVSPPKPLV